MIETIIIPITITALVLLLLWIIFHCSKVHWTLKLATCLLTGFLSIFVWSSIQEIKGWPVDDELPLKYRFHGSHVIEPSPTNGLGIIYVTASDATVKNDDIVTIAGFGILKKEPRVYKVPYDRESHKQTQEYQKAIAKGEAVFISREEEGTDGKKEGIAGKGKEKGQLSQWARRLGLRVPGFSQVKKQ